MERDIKRIDSIEKILSSLTNKVTRLETDIDSVNNKCVNTDADVKRIDCKCTEIGEKTESNLESIANFTSERSYKQATRSC
ncbi:hypothetical protein SNE40_014344 [Patella caerulea]|uniref:Uncharacterized protein n=1 Tax=Patella caerulea TaxID=87958 RepID=A0AAN8JE83_PATCE